MKLFFSRNWSDLWPSGQEIIDLRPVWSELLPVGESVNRSSDGKNFTLKKMMSLQGGAIAKLC